MCNVGAITIPSFPVAFKKASKLFEHNRSSEELLGEPGETLDDAFLHITMFQFSLLPASLPLFKSLSRLLLMNHQCPHFSWLDVPIFHYVLTICCIKYGFFDP